YIHCLTRFRQMQILSSLDQISFNDKIGVLVGNFDGVHLGHKYLINKFIDKCKFLKLKACIITFIPHPYFIFNPIAKSYLLSTYEEKKTLLKQCEPDYCVELEFSRDFSTMAA